jgi:hypothetical protein
MILLLDIDRTLNRLHPPTARSIRDLAPQELRGTNGQPFWDWATAHLSKVVYPPHEEAFNVLRLLSAHASGVFVNTGRPEALRAVSERWLRRHLNVDRIWMRASDDFRMTTEVKLSNLTELLRFHPSAEIYAFEDNVATLRSYKEAGLIGLHAPHCWDRLREALKDNNTDRLTQILRHHAFSSRATAEDEPN